MFLIFPHQFRSIFANLCATIGVINTLGVPQNAR